MTTKESHSLKALRWAIIGCGSVAQDFAKALKIADRNHRITVIGGSSMESAERFMKVHFLSERTKLFGDHAEAIQASDNYDIAYIGANSREHAPLVELALDNRRHVLCERPLASNASRMRELIEKARQNNCFLMEERKCNVNTSALASTTLNALFLSPSAMSINSWASTESGDVSRCETPSMDSFSSAPGNASCNVSGNHLLLDVPHAKPVFSTSSLRQELASCHLSSTGPCTGMEYTVNFALWIYDGQMPSRINAVGYIDEKGQNVWGSVTLEFGKNRVATLFYSTTQQSGYSPAIVVGTNGTLLLPDRFWCCTQLIAEYGNPRGTDSKQVLRFPIRKDNGGYKYPNGSAFYFEADHVYDRIMDGKLESDVMPLEESLKIALITNEICEKITSSTQWRSN